MGNGINRIFSDVVNKQMWVFKLGKYDKYRQIIEAYICMNRFSWVEKGIQTATDLHWFNLLILI